MADGFLGRWSQRKQAAREGRAVLEPVVAAKPSPAAPEANRSELMAAALLPGTSPLPQPGDSAPALAPAKPPAPTLEDVQALTAESGFARFVGRDVAPEVRNAAMKKLFADPHYNVMDRLDVYIDDYSQPDPLPVALLRQMASAKFLNLFEEDESNQATAAQIPPPQPETRTPVGDLLPAPALAPELPEAGSANALQTLSAPAPADVPPVQDTHP